MFDYGVYAADQSGYDPRDGDMDLGRGVGWNRDAAEYFGRGDWLYVYSGGTNGTRPAGPSASTMFPWGGQAVLRNDYLADGSQIWLWTKLGAYGSSGHAHRAKLAVNLRAYGSMLLVDSGRFQYNGVGLSKQIHDHYEQGTNAHNTLTIDAKPQSNTPALAKSPLPNSSWSFGEAEDSLHASMSDWEGLAGKATHSRGVVFRKQSQAGLPPYFLVVDRVEPGDRSRLVTANWHAHPNSTVKLPADTRTATIRGVDPATMSPTSAELLLVAASGQQGEGIGRFNSSEIVKGRSCPAGDGAEQGKDHCVWQGWYSQDYNGHLPAPTLVFSTEIPAGSATTFGWLLLPRKHRTEPAPAASVRLEGISHGVIKASVTIGDAHEKVEVRLGASASASAKTDDDDHDDDAGSGPADAGRIVRCSNLADCTHDLQTAINSGDDIELAPGVWTVEPIFFTSNNQTVTFGPEVSVVAKRGSQAFGVLFTANGTRGLSECSNGRLGL
mgnify:CR=1 FL=1